jgi:hypothetical protein
MGWTENKKERRKKLIQILIRNLGEKRTFEGPNRTWRAH